MNVQLTMAMVHVIRLAWIHLLDHTHVAAPMAMLVQAMGYHVTVSAAS